MREELLAPDNEDAYEDLGRELAYMLYTEYSPLLEDLELLLDARLSLRGIEANLQLSDEISEVVNLAVRRYRSSRFIHWEHHRLTITEGGIVGRVL